MWLEQEGPQTKTITETKHKSQTQTPNYTQLNIQTY